MDLACMCVKPQMRLYVCQALPSPNTNAFICVSPNAFICVSPNAFICVSPNAFLCVSPNVSADTTELASLAYFCSLRSHVFKQFKLEFLSKECSCLNTDSCLITDSCSNTDWTLKVSRCITQTTSKMDPKWSKMDPKWTQNGPKMDPKWTQNGPKMDPKWTQNGPEMDTELDTHINAFEAWHTYKRGSPSISSVFPEQLQTCVKNFKPIKINQGNLIYSWDNQLFSVNSWQKFFWRMKTLHIIKFCGNNTENESNLFQKKAKWVHSVWKQDLYMLLKLDNIPWLKALKNNSLREVVVKTLYHHNQQDGVMETQTLDPSESRAFSILGQKFLWEKWICDWFKLQQHGIFCRSTWETSVTFDCEGLYSQIKGESETTKERLCWITEHYSNERKKVDWSWWAFTIFFHCVRGLEESIQSSSTFTNNTTRRRRSSSILEDQEFSESISTVFLSVGWSLEDMFGSTRRDKKTSFSRTFRT